MSSFSFSNVLHAECILWVIRSSAQMAFRIACGLLKLLTLKLFDLGLNDTAAPMVFIAIMPTPAFLQASIAVLRRIISVLPEVVTKHDGVHESDLGRFGEKLHNISNRNRRTR